MTRSASINRTLIPKNLNITVGKRTPHSYLSELKAKNPNLESSLQEHLIPLELIADASWDRTFRRFLDTRAKAILKHIEQYVIEPSKEMEALYAAAHDGAESSISEGRGRIAPGLRTPESAFVMPILGRELWRSA